MPPPQERVGPPFTFDLLTFKRQRGGDDSVRLDIYIAVPYRSLEFLYAGDKYVSDYATNVEITKHAVDDQASTADRVFDRFQPHTILETTSQHKERLEAGREHADAAQLSATLAANVDYDIHLAVRDLNSKHEFDTTLIYRSHGFHTAAAALSDLMIYRSRRGQRVLPLIGPDVASLDGAESGVFAEAYELPAGVKYGLVTEVIASKAEHPPSETDLVGRWANIISAPLNVDAGRTAPSTVDRIPIFQGISFDDLWIGRYELRTYILPSVSDTALKLPDELSKHAIAQGVRRIVVTAERGVPISEPDIEMAIEQLRIIATSREWDSLTSPQNTNDKREAILEFWRKRNPEAQERFNRPMQIFYARVQYANDHFHGGFGEGWKSDRGRLYIALGAPDFVDCHPYEAMQKPYEVWEYSRYHTRYYFVDQYMLGDYRLSGPRPSSGTFVWDN